MTSNVLKIADEVSKLLEDLTEDPIEAQAVLQVVGTLVQAKWTKLAQKINGGGLIGG